ncbi:MAG: hypothetical protein QME75_10275 [Deltaproteobacteria bacterium]|nr:hypothetical protein [Deltaproteobacteria bacterium]
MSPVKPQIVAAISGAIQAYMQDEEACLAAAQMAQMAPRAAGPPPNLWGLSGRQAAMQIRQLMQRRSLR